MTTGVVGLADLTRADGSRAGGKGANLGELVRAGFAVPAGFVISTDAYRDFVAAAGIGAAILELAQQGDQGADTGSDSNGAAARIAELFTAHPVPAALVQAIATAYADLGAGPVAVRSSATAEDLAEAAFTGQQDTFLNVRGEEALLAAVRATWASLWTGRAIDYRARHGVDPVSLALAVVVQRLVVADASGVMFTADPTTGRRDRVLISAAWGLGESVVGGTVDPDQLVLARGGTVLERTTADKQVMTVPAADGVREQPVPPDLRRQPVLDDRSAAELGRLGVAIADHFGTPQDVEWARVEDTFAVLQSRPITALPPDEGPPPEDWSVPDPRSMYVRGSIIEQLPDPLTPLFADLIETSVVRSLTALMTELLGAGSVRPGDVALPTVNGYAYYRYSRRGMVRMTARAVRGLPVLLSGRRSGITRWRDVAHPRYVRIVTEASARPADELDGGELLTEVRRLLDAGTEYYTAVQTIIPVAATTEIAFTRFYEQLVRRPEDPPAITFLLGLDSAPILAEKALWDLAGWVRDQPDLLELLARTSSVSLADQLTGDQLTGEHRADDRPPAGVEPQTWSTFRDRFSTYLDRYGHSVYNLDFAVPLPADEPAPILDSLTYALGSSAADPYARQRRAGRARQEAIETVTARLGPVRHHVFCRLLRAAQRSGPIREDALADVGLAWPRLRRLVLAAGRRLVATGVVDEPADAFWLTEAELRSALSTVDPPPRRDQIEQAKRTWRGRRRVTPPQLLPQGSWFEVMRRWLPASSEDAVGDVLTGMGASGGTVVGPARVLTGRADFAAFRPGEVLVASITTPAWTPLFARAAAVVTDIGGPLSHSSIVAREYGIPAVLGTAVATRRIRSGQLVRVDGTAGTVTVLDD